jgi:hypothetical protein
MEQWVWSDSPHVATALGWESNSALREWLDLGGAWGATDSAKPQDAKLALELALREKRIPRSSSLYADLASKVGLARCQDPSVARLVSVLREWFST